MSRIQITKRRETPAGSTKQQWHVNVWLPSYAPCGGLHATWDLDDEPEIADDTPPSKVVELMSARNEVLWPTHLGNSQREIAQWVRENAKRVDAEWAVDEVTRMQREIDVLADRIESLRRYLIAEDPAT